MVTLPKLDTLSSAVLRVRVRVRCAVPHSYKSNQNCKLPHCSTASKLELDAK